MHTISGQLLKNMFVSGANNLYNHYPEIDALNVFPVPDGDTGMNMNLTMSSGSKEILNKSDDDAYAIAKAFSRGLLMGARGNSGVITSQIFRGFAKAIEGKTRLEPYDIALAFQKGKEVAYKAVMRPVEGTILTVIRESSDLLMVKGEPSNSVEECFEILINEARASLKRTPELLPVLKEVGVVDSGGAGLVCILEGMQKALLGNFVNKNQEGKTIVEDVKHTEVLYRVTLNFMVYTDGSKKQFIEKNFKEFAIHHGKDLDYTFLSENNLKIKLMMEHPGTILAYLQQFGEFKEILISPKGSEKQNEERKDVAVIAVCSGSGLEELFKQAGADYIVSGGQTMNPSIQDFIDAINEVNARQVFILPNNSNIVMAANQASEVIEEDIDVRVIPTKTIPQGLSSLMVFDRNENIDTNFINMKSALKNVTSGSITYAIKDTDIEGVHIVKDFYIGLKDKDIVTCVKERNEALNNLLAKMIDYKSKMVTILCGEGVSDEDIALFQEEISKSYPSLVVNVVSGKQPVYAFIIGVE